MLESVVLEFGSPDITEPDAIELVCTCLELLHQALGGVHLLPNHATFQEHVLVIQGASYAATLLLFIVVTSNHWYVCMCLDGKV